MKLLLSPFGIGTQIFQGYFRGMPAISLSDFNGRFLPDYPSILLFDEFVVDYRTIEQLNEESSYSRYSDFRELLNSLDVTGRLQVCRFEEILNHHRAGIDSSINYDLRNIETWVRPIIESKSQWYKYKDAIREKLTALSNERTLSPEEETILSTVNSQIINPNDVINYSGNSEIDKSRNLVKILKNWRKRLDQVDRKWAKIVVSEHIRYITNNICLSDNLDAVIYDWADMEPLYKHKFKASLRTDISSNNEQQQIRRLFEITCPSFEPKDAKTLIHALEDKRIDSLRNLVKEAIAGRVEFDQEFAVRTLREVLNAEKHAAKVKKLSGWLTIPLGLIPWLGTPIQKAVEEGINFSAERSMKKGKEWFYLINDISKSKA